MLLHSTSWRWEPDGRVVLTYLAWARDGSLPGTACLLPKLAPPGPTDPLHPRPAQYPELDPLAHGLRHLAFLLRTGRDGALAAALGPRAAALLAKLYGGRRRVDAPSEIGVVSGGRRPRRNEDAMELERVSLAIEKDLCSPASIAGCAAGSWQPLRGGARPGPAPPRRGRDAAATPTRWPA